MSSKNGTYINRNKIDDEESLFVYDVINVGNFTISIDAKSLTSFEFESLSKKMDPNYWGENITDILKTSKFVLKDAKKKISRS